MSEDELPAGRELDAEIARRVMGLAVSGKGTDDDPYWIDDSKDDNGCWLGDYSTEIGWAWDVVQRMQELGFWCEMRTPFGTVMEGLDDGYWAGFTPHGTSGWNGTPDHWTTSEALPLSICRAALKAVGAHKE